MEVSHCRFIFSFSLFLVRTPIDVVVQKMSDDLCINSDSLSDNNDPPSRLCCQTSHCTSSCKQITCMTIHILKIHKMCVESMWEYAYTMCKSLRKPRRVIYIKTYFHFILPFFSILLLTSILLFSFHVFFNACGISTPLCACYVHMYAIVTP